MLPHRVDKTDGQNWQTSMFYQLLPTALIHTLPTDACI